MDQARRRERGLIHVFRVTTEIDEMDRMAETRDAANYMTTLSTMTISFAGATQRDLVRPPFVIAVNLTAAKSTTRSCSIR